MKEIAAKEQYDGVTNPAPDNQVHTHTEVNDRNSELQNAVTNTGLALAEADANQLSKAMFANGVAAQAMLDSGGVNTIVLTPLTGSTGLRVPLPAVADYSALNGAVLLFKANNTNSGNTTVNIGQTVGGLVGAKSLFMPDGTTQIPASYIVAGRYYRVMYSAALASGAGAFILLDSTTKAYVDVEIASKTTMVPPITGAGTGYEGQESITFPNGLIIKSGYVARADVITSFNFVVAFPNAVISGQVTPYYSADYEAPSISSLTPSGMSIYAEGPVTGYFWMAIGR
jgi:hypothetical protein